MLNDERMGAIKFLQEALYGRWGEADLTNPDFPALAHAFGLPGQRVERLDDLPQALSKALGHPGPAERVNDFETPTACIYCRASRVTKPREGSEAGFSGVSR